MPTYKTLKSVAHNLGHSFLSDMNTVDGFQTFIGETLLEIAQEHDEPQVRFDFLKKSIFPEAFDRPDTRRSLDIYCSMLRRLIDDQGAAWPMVAGATMTLRFDLDHQRQKKETPGRRPRFECRVEIVDDRGRRHSASPANWWSDPMGGLSRRA